MKRSESSLIQVHMDTERADVVRLIARVKGGSITNGVAYILSKGIDAIIQEEPHLRVLLVGLKPGLGGRV